MAESLCAARRSLTQGAIVFRTVHHTLTTIWTGNRSRAGYACTQLHLEVSADVTPLPRQWFVQRALIDEHTLNGGDRTILPGFLQLAAGCSVVGAIEV